MKHEETSRFEAPDITILRCAYCRRELALGFDIISGMVIDPALEEAMKVTVIATGFDRHADDRPRIPAPPKREARSSR